MKTILFMIFFVLSAQAQELDRRIQSIPLWGAFPLFSQRNVDASAKITLREYDPQKHLLFLSSSPDGEAGLIVDNQIRVNGLAACNCFAGIHNPDSIRTGIPVDKIFYPVNPVDLTRLFPEPQKNFTLTFEAVDFGGWGGSLLDHDG